VEERLRTRGKLEMAGSYNAQWARLDLPPVPPQIGDTRFTLVRLIGTALLDGRNDLIDTTRGYFSSASYEFGDRSLGSDFPIRKLLLQQFVYLPAGRVVFASAARFERAGGEGTAFFPEDRLLAGGANTVRGYVENSLRAVGVNLLGGVTSLLVLNQELRFPIAGPVRGVVFADGAVFEARLEGDRNSESRWSTGLGLRYVTPVGILRLDFGIPLDQGFEPRRGRFYFSLGQVF
jgi:outer membrane protein assembly factor BamA